MTRWPHTLAALCTVGGLICSLAAAAAPAMVTTTRGQVDIVRDEGSHTAPPPPFLLEEGDRLTLADGALVVVLFEGAATQLLGPREVAQGDFKTREATARHSAAALDSLLVRSVVSSRAGASRGAGDGVHLVRPVPGSKVLEIPYVSFRCGDCGDENVVLYDFRNDAEVWTAAGTGPIPYSGPELDPGAYLLGLGDRDHAITVVGPEERAEVEALLTAVRAAEQDLVGDGADQAASTSLVASVYLQAGYPSEALYVIDAALALSPDDAALRELRDTFELRAGIAP